MREGFVAWAMFFDYAQVVAMVFMFVKFTKELPFIKSIPTKYYSWMVAFTIVTISHIHAGTFAYWDLILYGMSGILISLAGNGAADFNGKVTKEK